MERTITVRIPEILAAKLDRVAEAEGMTQSELVRHALRLYFTTMLSAAADAISTEVRPQLEAEGVTAATVEDWYKRERKKKAAAPAKGSNPNAVRA